MKQNWFYHQSSLSGTDTPISMPVRLMALHPIHSTCVHGQSGMSEGGRREARRSCSCYRERRIRFGRSTRRGGSDIRNGAAPASRQTDSSPARRNAVTFDTSARASERPAATNAEREGIEIMDASDEGDTPTACSNRQQKKRGGGEEEDCAVLTARGRSGAPPTRGTRSPTKS